MTGTEIYKRTEVYEREASTIRLLPPHWKLLLAFDGESMLLELGVRIGMNFTEVLPLAGKFLKQGWIEEQPITLEQYLRRAGAEVQADDNPVPAVTPPITEVHTPPPLPVTAPFVPLAPVEPSPHSVPQLPPALPVRSAGPQGPMRLGSVVDYITSLTGNLALGRFLVYRVFLRVPSELLQAEDIVSIHLVNEGSLIRGLELQKAIAAAVQEIAGRPLPDGVFAPA